MDSWRPLIFRLAISLAYASIFPISNLLGGGIMILGILVSIPFLPVAWIAGIFLCRYLAPKLPIYQEHFLQFLFKPRARKLACQQQEARVKT